MTISFNQVPSNIRVPFMAVEFDNTRAQQGAALLPYTALLVGQRLSTGSAAANTLHKVSNVNQVIALAGRGSMLHKMAKRYFENNSFTDTYIGVLDDNGAGVNALGSVTIGGTVTAAGTLALYIGGEVVTIGVPAAQAATATATALAAAINMPLEHSSRTTAASVRNADARSSCHFAARSIPRRSAAVSSRLFHASISKGLGSSPQANCNRLMAQHFLQAM